MALCPRCVTPNPDEARFCFACGAPLGAATPPTAELRKTVTIVFSDLTGSTQMGERLDSESLRQVMSRYFEATRAVLERHGGTVEKFIGDAVMAVFGIPLVREDDALRAVRATAEMRDAIAELNDQLEARWGIRLRVRTGVNTGEVVAGDASRGQNFATGDAVNVAARLEQAAGADEILISEETHRLVRDAVRVEPVEPLTLKGKSRPVPAFRVIQVVADAPGVARRLDSPIVGRGAELDRLEQAFARAARERACHLVTVLGPAGVGKSRLAHELTSALEGQARVLRGRCLPYGEGITYWPVAEIVRRAAGIGVRDSTDEALAKLAALVPDDDDGATVVERVAGAVGLGDAAASPEETFWAVRRLLEALAAEGPLVLILDDVHWAESTFMDLIRYLASHGGELPALVVALARPDVLEAHPWLAGTDGDGPLVLAPLSVEESQLLIDNLLDHAPAAEEVRERIAAAGAGNPLFVEELLRMLIDDGALERAGGRWTHVPGLASASVPPTIQALLAARLDRLTPAERTVIERAAVIGRGFWRGALRALSPHEDAAELESLLDALVRKELVEPGGARFAGEDGLCLSHTLIRDVAYQGMLKETRADLHERFADWLEGEAGERVTEYEEILGYHLERSYRYRAELAQVDPRAERMAARGANRLGRSGRRALARGDMPAAVKLLERALALLSQDDPLRADLSLKLGIALAETGDLARADSLLSDRLDSERRGRPFLTYRDGTARQRLFDLDSVDRRVTIGRQEGNDIALSWDGGVSRYHAAMERVGEGWAIVDEGTSRNGSFLNGRRVIGRLDLHDGDVLRFGNTVAVYHMPVAAPTRRETKPGMTVMAAAIPVGAEQLSDSERRVLAVLSTQLSDQGASEAPVTGGRIAEELAMSPDDVEATLARLLRKFHTDHLPEDQRHDRLVERASQSGLFQRPDA